MHEFLVGPTDSPSGSGGKLSIDAKVAEQFSIDETPFRRLWRPTRAALELILRVPVGRAAAWADPLPLHAEPHARTMLRGCCY
jgi:hypothetical protein